MFQAGAFKTMMAVFVFLVVLGISTTLYRLVTRAHRRPSTSVVMEIEPVAVEVLDGKLR